MKLVLQIAAGIILAPFLFVAAIIALGLMASDPGTWLAAAGLFVALFALAKFMGLSDR